MCQQHDPRRDCREGAGGGEGDEEREREKELDGSINCQVSPNKKLSFSRALSLAADLLLRAHKKTM